MEINKNNIGKKWKISGIYKYNYMEIKIKLLDNSAEVPFQKHSTDGVLRYNV